MSHLLRPRSDLSFGLPSLRAGSRFRNAECGFRNALDTSLQSVFKNLKLSLELPPFWWVPGSEIQNLKSHDGLATAIHEISGLSQLSALNLTFHIQ